MGCAIPRCEHALVHLQCSCQDGLIPGCKVFESKSIPSCETHASDHGHYLGPGPFQTLTVALIWTLQRSLDTMNGIIEEALEFLCSSHDDTHCRQKSLVNPQELPSCPSVGQHESLSMA